MIVGLSVFVVVTYGALAVGWNVDQTGLKTYSPRADTPVWSTDPNDDTPKEGIDLPRRDAWAIDGRRWNTTGTCCICLVDRGYIG